MATLFSSPLKIIMAGLCLVVMWHGFRILWQQGKWGYLYMAIFIMSLGNILFNIQLGYRDVSRGVESLQGKIVSLSSRNDFILLIVIVLGFTVKSQFNQYQKRIECLEQILAERDKP